MLDGFKQYLAGGLAMTTGFHPASLEDVTALGKAIGEAQDPSKFKPVNVGARNMQYGSYLFGFDQGNALKAPQMYGKMHGYGGMHMLGPGMQILSSGYMMYHGYQDNGMAGAKDALMLDIAVNSAMAGGYSYNAQTGAAVQKLGKLTISGAMLSKGGSYTKMIGGGIGLMKTGITGYALGGLGQSIAGTPGAFAGAYLGGKLGRGTSSLVIAGGAIAAAAGAEVVKRGSAILKAGYMNQQMRRRIDTAGSMASFMTQNAYTERSRAVQAMHRSHLNARSALGSEAGYMHRNTDYFSRYKRF